MRRPYTLLTQQNSSTLPWFTPRYFESILRNYIFPLFQVSHYSPTLLIHVLSQLLTMVEGKPRVHRGNARRTPRAWKILRRGSGKSLFVTIHKGLFKMAPSKYPLAVTFDSESAMYYSTSSGSPTSFNFEKALACQEDTSTYSRETYPLEIFATHPFPRMTDLRPIKGRLIATLSGMLGILKLVVIYLLSELMIWGCSRVLSLLNAAFFASIVSMVLVAMSITTASLFFPAVGIFYETHVKSEVSVSHHLEYRLPY